MIDIDRLLCPRCGQEPEIVGDDYFDCFDCCKGVASDELVTKEEKALLDRLNEITEDISQALMCLETFVSGKGHSFGINYSHSPVGYVYGCGIHDDKGEAYALGGGKSPSLAICQAIKEALNTNRKETK